MLRARDRLGAGPRRACAGAGAHDGRPRECGRRDRDGTGQPCPGRDRRRAAGPPSPRLRALSRRATPRGSRANTRCGPSSRCGRRMSRARSTAPGTRPRPRVALRWSFVPMDDWLQEADDGREDAAAGRVIRTHAAGEAAVAELAAFLDGARTPAIVAGAGAADEETWTALTRPRRTAGRSGVPGVVRLPRRLPAGSAPTSRASCRPTALACVRCSHHTTLCSSSAPARSDSRPGHPVASRSPGRASHL